MNIKIAHKDGNCPVLFTIKREPITINKKVCMCLLNIRSLGDDTKMGKIRDLVENDMKNLDLEIFTETWLCPDNTSSHQKGDITPPWL